MSLRRSAADSARQRPQWTISPGQSLVEFTLVLPILLLLLLTVADFSRLFAAGIAVESAARTSAEVVAGEYLRALGSPGDANLATAADYSQLARSGWQSTCDELKGLPNVTYASPGVECSGAPTVVCVHDNADPGCATVYNVGGGVSPQCSEISAGPPTNTRPATGETSRYVEVRLCYRFSTLFSIDLPFLGLRLSPLGGDFYLQRTRTFTVADY